MQSAGHARGNWGPPNRCPALGASGWASIWSMQMWPGPGRKQQSPAIRWEMSDARVLTDGLASLACMRSCHGGTIPAPRAHERPHLWIRLLQVWRRQGGEGRCPGLRAQIHAQAVVVWLPASKSIGPMSGSTSVRAIQQVTVAAAVDGLPVHQIMVPQDAASANPGLAQVAVVTQEDFMGSDQLGPQPRRAAAMSRQRGSPHRSSRDCRSCRARPLPPPGSHMRESGGCPVA